MKFLMWTIHQEVATTEHTLQSTKKDYYRERETNGVWNYIEVLEASLVEKRKKGVEDLVKLGKNVLFS